MDFGFADEERIWVEKAAALRPVLEKNARKSADMGRVGVPKNGNGRSRLKLVNN
jgi:hypothetical protein